MPCETYQDHRLSSPRIVRVGHCPVNGYYREVERHCEFPDCGRVFRGREFGAEESSSQDVVNHLTTGGS